MGDGLVVQHNIQAMFAQRALTTNTFDLNKSLERLSSGYKINRAGDDAAGLAISEKLRAQVRGLNRAQNNIMDGISLIQTAEGGLQEVQNILQRLRELAVQASNDTLTQSDRVLIQLEVDQLLYEIDRTVSTTEFNTKKLLNGVQEDGSVSNQVSLTFHVGANNLQTIKVTIDSIGTTGLGIDILKNGDDQGNGIVANKGVVGQTNAESAITLFNNAINQISALRARLGAFQNRLEHSYNQVSIEKENLQAAESRMRDTDVADEIVKYTKNQILVQAGTSILAQANLRTQSVLQLLQ